MKGRGTIISTTMTFQRQRFVIVLLDLSGGLVGLTLVYSIHLSSLFQWAVRQSAEVENQVISTCACLNLLLFVNSRSFEGISYF